jgi:CubicO group peptidase (beta-lactamase class C family)
MAIVTSATSDNTNAVFGSIAMTIASYWTWLVFSSTERNCERWPTAVRRPAVFDAFARSSSQVSSRTGRAGQGAQVTDHDEQGLSLRDVEDYARFAQMLLNGGELNAKRLLAPKTVGLMRSVSVSNALPGLPKGLEFGLGVRVFSDPVALGRRVDTGSYGWDGLVTSSENRLRDAIDRLENA